MQTDALLLTQYREARVYTVDGTVDIGADEYKPDPLADNDTDGMPDTWETQYFGGTNNPTGQPNIDTDGDGMSNLEEYLAGTDPMNPGSALEVTSVECRGTRGGDPKLVLAWRSESNKWYGIGCSSNLMSVFRPVASNIPATYPLNTRTVDVDSAENGFLVIRLEQ